MERGVSDAQKANSLSLSRRHFRSEGHDDSVGRLRTVELIVHHLGQLFWTEMHVLIQVLVLLGSR